MTGDGAQVADAFFIIIPRKQCPVSEARAITHHQQNKDCILFQSEKVSNNKWYLGRK